MNLDQRVRALLLLALSLALASLAPGAHAAGDASSVAVEIGEGPSEMVERRLVARLIALELAEISVPPPALRGSSLRTTPAYVRVLATGAGADLEVELWHRGVFEGRRTVSGSSSQRVLARRIALVSAELLRHLARRRERQARAVAKLQAQARRRSEQQRGVPIFAAWETHSDLQAHQLGRGAWLLGGAVSGGLAFDRVVFVGLGVGVHAGAIPNSKYVGWLQSQDLLLTTTRAFTWRRHRLDTGMEAAVGVVTFGRTGSELLTQRTTREIVPRVALTGHYGLRVSSWLDLSCGLKGGVLLRDVPVADVPAAPRLGWTFAGAELGLRMNLSAL